MVRAISAPLLDSGSKAFEINRLSSQECGQQSPGRWQIMLERGKVTLGVKCVTPFEMLHKEKARFVLDSQS